MRFRMWLVLLVSVFACSGCATIVTGSDQDIQFNSDPEGATVEYDNGKVLGTTPFTKTLRKTNEGYNVVFKLAGYRDNEVRVRGGFNKWVLGNLLFFPGWIIDLVTDAFWEMKPKEVYAKMHANETPASGGDSSTGQPGVIQD